MCSLWASTISIRNFYEIEASDQEWNLNELKRQFNSGLYERLALSRDKEGIRQLAQQGQIISQPKDLLNFDADHFYIYLVFYNRLLRCYVLIDLKIGKLTHQNLGQMQMYVNYFDRYVKTDGENATIGIILCKKKTRRWLKSPCLKMPTSTHGNISFTCPVRKN